MWFGYLYRVHPHTITRAGLPSSILRPYPPGAESFGLFSCIINGLEQEQTHRAIFR